MIGCQLPLLVPLAAVWCCVLKSSHILLAVADIFCAQNVN